MKSDNNRREPVSWRRAMAAAMVVAGALCAAQVQAQVPARFYWKTLSGATAVPLVFQSVGGNTNPFDPAGKVLPDGNIGATMSLVGYGKFLPLFDRAAMIAVMVPMGRMSGELTVAGNTVTEAASGFGDPMIELAVNIVGPPPQLNIPDAMRYEPGFSLDLLADLAVPLGEYDTDKPLNIGQNCWYGRLGAPVVWQLGAWVPGRRTTVELLPAVWMFGDNDDFVGRTLQTDPLFQLDVHLTRDLTESFWSSLDGSWYSGGQASIDGVEGEKLDNMGVGLTLGYQVNQNMGLTFGYKSSLNDDEPTDLRMDNFMISLVYGWHKLVEGMNRLKGGE